MKKQNYKKLYQILVIVDDFADEASFSRHSKLLHSLYTRGRHNSISTITATQAFTALSTLIRRTATELLFVAGDSRGAHMRMLLSYIYL